MFGHQWERGECFCYHGTCETCLCVNPSWNYLFQEQVWCAIPAWAYPDTWKCRECFLFVSISYINILCCQQDWYKIPNSGFIYLKALQPWTQTWFFSVQELHHSPNFEQFPRNTSNSAWRRIYPLFLNTEILFWLKAHLKMPTLLLQYLKRVPENYKSA